MLKEDVGSGIDEEGNTTLVCCVAYRRNAMHLLLDVVEPLAPYNSVFAMSRLARDLLRCSFTEC